MKWEISYLDLKLIVLKRGIYHHDEREGNESFLLLVLKQVLEISKKLQSVLIQALGRDVHAEKALLGANFSMELKHFLQVLGINHQVSLLLVEILRYSETTENVNLTSVDGAEQAANHDFLVLWLS